MKNRIKIIAILSLIAFSFGGIKVAKSTRSKKAVKKCTPILKKEFKKQELKWGSNIYFRIFKQEKQMQVWVKKSNTFSLFKTYKICYFSGGLGTKTKQGDGKSPEGFYYLKPRSMNPYSSYHLSFNIGYPNKYERQKKYTGSALMVHGNCVSIGCYAMGDKNIEEIYTLLESAFEHNQGLVRIHIFPFKFTNKIMNAKEIKSKNDYKFWQNLRQGYEFFQKKRIPPNVEVIGGKYVFN